MRAPDSREAISKTLSERGLSPLHRRGQNFLVRPGVLDRAVEAAEVVAGDVVLEVGPGCGGLTERLLLAGARVIAVEIDVGLADVVAEFLGAESRLSLLRTDVMEKKSALSAEVDAALEGVPRWKVCSNLPYQVSSPFLSACALHPRPPERLVVTLQNEVGRVLRAGPGDADYSPLSFLARLAWGVTRVESVPAAAFWPRPQVDSAVMRLDRAPSRTVPLGETVAFARRLFQGRRKALRNTVAKALSPVGEGDFSPVDVDGLLDRAGLSADDRIDAAAPEAIERLYGLAVGRG
ncbi:MAG: 16S rRNA (adenine(1518)-N(6)/adenine(1519)-N(6))-dimethyltransferase RsmA [Planctomycetota bacterium]|nr:ribosomal RNA small subunit methyltransferase A [Planctomycetota bacterium]MEE2712851.1 16S rRNA (adenine(1518)-N(6)/adenine(1519)-N(6))-dimethyltransferase RsmA [Planctomycetota bacterium]